LPFLLGSSELGIGSLECSFGDAPFGAHRCLPRQQLRKRGLSFTRDNFRLAQFARDPCRVGLGILEPLADEGAFLVELGNRACSIFPQRLLARDVAC
jgi:hypothetical protein